MRYALGQCECIESYAPHTYTFTGPCIVTGETHSVTVPADGLYKYHQGAYIQDAFPDLSADDREFLLSGISPAGWAVTFEDDAAEVEIDDNRKE